MKAVESEVGANTSSRSRHLVRDYGIVGIALFLVATSKWGSYLPLTKPPFITDLVLAAVFVRRILVGSSRSPGEQQQVTVVRILVSLMVAWSAIEFLRGSYSLTAVRDLAPYFYALVALIVVVPVDDDVRRRTSHGVDAANLFHAGWVGLAVVAPTVYGHLPFLAGQVHLLQPRNDFDGAVCGIFAALGIYRALSGERTTLNLSLAGVNAVLMLFLRERAGLLAFVAALAVVAYLLARTRYEGRRQRAGGVAAFLMLLMPVLYLAGSHTPAYQRTLAAVHTFVPFVHASDAYAADTGTESARQKAWSRVLSWQDETVGRETIGVGFGPDFMKDSGAVDLLNGGPDVRSPHDYLVGTSARLGLVGVLIVSGVIVTGLWMMVALARRAEDLDGVDVFAMLVVAAIPVAAAVGVILESPFGAVPYFWALGHLGARLETIKRPDDGRLVVLRSSRGPAAAQADGLRKLG